MKYHTDTLFVDAKDRITAIKKARKKLKEKYGNRLAKDIFSVKKQDNKRIAKNKVSRYVVWYRVRARKKG